VPGLDARQLLAELRDRLVEEVDYVREAEAQTAFADAYRDDPDIAVPDVLAVGGQVLVTRWVDALPCRGSSRMAPGTTGTPPAGCWSASSPPRPCAPAGCTATRTPATSGCCPRLPGYGAHQDPRTPA
jgi:hypothetical protein